MRGSALWEFAEVACARSAPATLLELAEIRDAIFRHGHETGNSPVGGSSSEARAYPPGRVLRRGAAPLSVSNRVLQPVLASSSLGRTIAMRPLFHLGPKRVVAMPTWTTPTQGRTQERRGLLEDGGRGHRG